MAILEQEQTPFEPSIDQSDEHRPASGLKARRWIFFALVVASCALLFGWLARLLTADGFDLFDGLMLVLYAGTLPWVVIGLWNAVIGFSLIQFKRDWLHHVVPLEGLETGEVAQTAPTAIVVPIFNEDPEAVVHHLKAIEKSLAEMGRDEAFEFFLLSDTQDPQLAEQEQNAFLSWQRASTRPSRLTYRRRTDNKRRKVGNIEDFCEHWGNRFKYMIVLDADSLMSGKAILRLTHLMERNPQLGILQTLVVGLPSDSAFGRIFQFGMRHGMRSYTTGSAWWQGDAGPYWGHNAIVRLAPFRAHCTLPRLPGKEPLGGEILSHDQVEAALMRAAGYEVRVLPIEDGSYERNPPSLPDFVKRDLRWCQGNMQYFGLLNWRVWRPMGRVQLALAILMYLSSPMWLGFLFLGLTRMVLSGYEEAAGALALPQAVVDRVASTEGILFFATMMTIAFAPKIMGVADILVSSEKRKRYGGGLRMAIGSLVEIVFGALLAPIMAVAQSLFIAGLFIGGKASWNGQQRDAHSVSWWEALTGFWPQTIVGLIFAVGLWRFHPEALPWAAPLLLSWGLAIPFAALSASPALGRLVSRYRLCGIPEEFEMPAEVTAVETKRSEVSGTGSETPALTVGSAAPMTPATALGQVIPSRPES